MLEDDLLPSWVSYGTVHGRYEPVEEEARLAFHRLYHTKNYMNCRQWLEGKRHGNLSLLCSFEIASTKSGHLSSDFSDLELPGRPWITMSLIDKSQDATKVNHERDLVNNLRASFRMENSDNLSVSSGFWRRPDHCSKEVVKRTFVGLLEMSDGDQSYRTPHLPKVIKPSLEERSQRDHESDKTQQVAMRLHQCETGVSCGGKLKLNLDDLELRATDIPVTALMDSPIGKSLFKLSLSRNPLCSLPDKLVQNLPSLYLLELSLCELVTLPILWYMPQLRKLNLSYNKLTEFPSKVRHILVCKAQL
jgi:hypothetical protein